MSKVFPEFITSLPEADIPLKGVKAYLSQSRDHQIVFMEFSEDVEISTHSHGAQWGVVLEGEIELVIGGVPHTFGKGDSYFILNGVEHSARIRKGYADVTFFDEPDRFKAK